MAAAVTQPKALQMYQLLDNMEIEDQQAMTQEASALYDEHAGLMRDQYSSLLHAFELRLRDARDAGADGPHDHLVGELAEAEEERRGHLLALEKNQTRLDALIRELPSRIVSVERLQATRTH